MVFMFFNNYKKIKLIGKGNELIGKENELNKYY